MLKRNSLLIVLGSVGAFATLGYVVHWGGGALAPVKASNRMIVSSKSAAAVDPAAVQADALALAFRPEDGETMAYQYEMRSFSDVDVGYLLKVAGASTQGSNAARGDRQRIEVTSRGRLNFKFFAAPAGGWNVGARVTELTYSMGDQASADRGAMKQPFAFSFKSDGTLDGFAFTPGVSPKARAALKQILSWFQIVVPKEPRATWFGSETDATGTFQARYDLLDSNVSAVTISKRKTNYVSLATSLTPRANSTLADVVLSKLTYNIPRSGAWLTSATLEEKLSLRTGGLAWGNVYSAGSIQSLSQVGMASWPVTFDDFRAEVQSSAYQSAKYYETDPTLDALWANLSTSSAVARFASMWSKERKLAEALMVNFLRQKPSRSAELIRLLDESTKRDTGIDENTRLTLWRLNAKAGHKEAQTAQVDAALSPSFSRRARMNALAHLDFENPEPSVVERALQFRRSTVTTTDRSERELGSMALLTVGGLGDASHANQAMNDTIAQKLVGYLSAAKTPADTATALQAIGNTGNSVALDAVKPYLNSSDESIRVNALEALRRMDSPQATGVAIESFEQNTDVETRTAALRSLSTMPATPETMNWGRNALSSTMADETRSQLAAWLASQASNYPENATVLRELLRNTTSFEVKKSILKYISPS